MPKPPTRQFSAASSESADRPTVVRRRMASAAALALAATGLLLASHSSAGAASMPTAVHSGYTVKVVATGSGIKSNPDDIAVLGSRVFIGYQNGVGPLGEPATGTGQTQSTIVEYAPDGRQVAAWKITGKCDGLGADPSTNEVLASVNEDGNSSLYAIHPDANRVVHLAYSPDPATLGGGGTDGIALHGGQIFTSGSNSSGAAPAVYSIALNETTKVATLSPVFNDNAAASGPSGPVTLALTDPDSLATVPQKSPRFAGDIVLNSQGDSQLIFVQNPASTGQTLTQLPIATQIDDLTWATSAEGTLYMTDNTGNRLYSISTDSFTPGTVFVDTASDSNTPGFVGTLDLTTGHITPVVVGFINPHGLRFVPKG